MAGLNDHDYAPRQHSKKITLKGNETAIRIVQNVWKYITELTQVRFPGLELNITEEVSRCTQVSKDNIRAYSQGPTVENSAKIQRQRKRHMEADSTVGREIRKGIYDFYTKDENVTLLSLQVALREKQIFFGCTASLHRILKDLGFKYSKDDSRKYLMEQPHIRELKLSFLEHYIQNENRGAGKLPLIFLDETWIFSNGTVRKSWQDGSVHAVKRKSGEGSRYIIVHAGSSMGFVENAGLLFKSKLKTGDYHGEMNSENFEQWLQNQLLPHLKHKSIIVLDNAPYHSRQLEKMPTKLANKTDMQKWLDEKHISYSDTCTKNDLWTLIDQQPKPPKRYVVDALITEQGHEVLRLPPYHCEYNAIEMVWSQAKRFYDKHVLQTKDVLKTWEIALESVTQEQWTNYVEHTHKIIMSDWEQERRILESRHHHQPFIINLGDSSEDDFSN